MTTTSLPRTHRRCAALAAGALALTLAGCGGGADESSDESGSENGDGLTAITVGVQPFAELAPLYIAQERGLFDEHGLEVTVQPASQGAELITAMVAGELPIVYSNYFSLLTAADQGLPVRVFRENDRPGVQGLYVVPDSDITEPGDFEGASIAVSGLGNVMEITSRAVLEHHGVDLDSVEFVELAPPTMLQALEQGQVDAAWLVEPFATLGQAEQDVRMVVSAFEGPSEDSPVAGWATTADVAESDPDMLAAFSAAMDEAMEIVHSEPDAVAEIIPTYTEMTPELASSLGPVGYAEGNDLADLSIVEDLLLRYDIISGPVDLDSLIVSVEE
jgi:NitT/TauT family transport system substrate-binding protein